MKLEHPYDSQLLSQEPKNTESSPNAVGESELKLAAIREWLKKEHDQMSYIQIVHGIKSVLDWSLAAQDSDRDLILEHTTDSSSDFPSIKQIIRATDMLAKYGVTPDVYKEHYDKGTKPSSAVDDECPICGALHNRDEECGPEPASAEGDEK